MMQHSDPIRDRKRDATVIGATSVGLLLIAVLTLANFIGLFLAVVSVFLVSMASISLAVSIDIIVSINRNSR